MKKNQEKITLTKEQIFAPLTDEQLKSLTHGELLVIARNEQKIRLQYEELHRRLEKVESLNRELQEEKLLIEDKYVRVKCRLLNPKSERSPKRKPGDRKQGKERDKVIKLPSDRYPNAQIIVKDITFEQTPICQSCQGEMLDSGMTETSEYLTVIPKQYLIVRQHRHKYRCPCCHADVQTAPALPRVIPGSSYSDEMIVDVTLSKYCDLIPIERYCEMAKRQGFAQLPAHSLIGLTFKLAEFLFPICTLIREETLNSGVLLGDETTHRMLEGDDKQKWYLWCFSSPTSCFFEYHDTRAGEVAEKVLQNSNCRVFMSDAYSGYGRAIKDVNKMRKIEGKSPIVEVMCNAHARRYFDECSGTAEEPREGNFFIDQYKEIYALEKKKKVIQGSPDEGLILRTQMSPYFELMKKKAEEGLESYSSQSHFYKSCQYYLNHYMALTEAVKDPSIPLDNNQSERELRGPVVGRKTWYGTHSKEGARVAAIHFTIVNSCKLSGANPREYYREIIKAIQQNKTLFTPSEFVKQQKENLRQEATLSSSS